MKKFLNEIIFLNFICVITSAKFFIDFATKMTTFNSNNLKMIDVLNLIISASSALVQMSRSVVGNSNSSKHSSLTHLSEPAKTEWEIMISFVIDFDNLIVFYSPFCFFFFFLFWPFPRVDLLASHHIPTGRTNEEEEWKKSRRCVFLLNWGVFKFDYFTNFAEWDSCFSRVFLRLLCSFVKWTIYYFLCSQK